MPNTPRQYPGGLGRRLWGARGDEGPDLHAVQVSDRYLVNIITHGIPHEMPSFAKKHGPADLTALTAYVRSLEWSDVVAGKDHEWLHAPTLSRPAG